MQRLRQTVHRGDQTKIQYSTQRTTKKRSNKKHPKKSELAEHCLQSGHTIAWESSSILRANSSWRTRHLLEVWEINTCKNPLNRDDGRYLPQECRALTLLDKKLIFQYILIFISNNAILNKLVTSFAFLLPLKKAYARSRNVGTLRSFSVVFSASVTFLYFIMQPPGYKSILKHSNLFPQRIQLNVRCPLNSCQTLLFSPEGLTEICIENRGVRF